MRLPLIVAPDCVVTATVVFPVRDAKNELASTVSVKLFPERPETVPVKACFFSVTVVAVIVLVSGLSVSASILWATLS